MSMKAMQSLAVAIAGQPENAAYKERFIETIAPMRFRFYLPDLAMFIQHCLETPGINHAPLVRPWFSMLKAHPRFRKVFRLARRKDYASFRAAFEKLRDPDIFNPYFLSGLGVLLVPDRSFERFLIFLRRYCLEQFEAGAGSDKFADLLEPLARYCFRTEYVFAFGDEEAARIAVLRREVEKNRAGGEADIFMLGCYEPLHTLDNAAAVADRLRKLGYAGLAAEQISDFLVERELRHEIPALTPIDSGVSTAVQAQYEAFPYPRWSSLASSLSLDALEAFLPGGAIDSLKKDGAKFLIAGCGTGLQALEYALAFPKAEVLAVDLSRASLSYGLRNAKERGIGNLRFAQADIMRLGGLEDRFDFILCTGVLHHMADPEAGWAVLEGLLSSGGLMRIALYSEYARQFIVRSRAVIQARGYGDSREEIRRFREDAPDLLKRSDYRRVTRSSDFYSMSECRDMLFHVQEHRHTIPEIEGMLERLGLRFIRFEMEPRVRARYHKAFPQDEAGTNLANWNRFEHKKPETFLQMYRFWCSKTMGTQ